MEVRGTWTLPAIASAIKNNLTAGLKSGNNFPFSLEQLEYVVVAERNNYVVQMMRNPSFDEKFGLIQEINCIPLDCNNFSLCDKLDTKDPALHFEVPMMIDVEYVGLATSNHPFKIYHDRGSTYNKYRNKKLVDRPYIRFKQYEGKMHGFIFNPPTSQLKFISVHGILENPRAINQFSCASWNPREDRFPAPPEMIADLINKITSDWSSWYYRFQGAKPTILQQPVA